MDLDEQGREIPPDPEPKPRMPINIHEDDQ
jgi:hypothetical protein